MIVGLTTLETVWLRTAQSLDTTLKGLFPHFFQEVVIPAQIILGVCKDENRMKKKM